MARKCKHSDPECSKCFGARIEAQCETIADHRWKWAEENITRIASIGIRGPEFEDKDFVRSIFTMVLFELTQRRKAASDAQDRHPD